MADYTVPLEFEAEIRDTQEHYSDEDPDADADFTVVTQEFHTNYLRRYQRVRVYIDDTHDESFDIEIKHTWQGDTDFSGEVNHATVTFDSGQDSTTTTLDGPVHKLRLRFATGALASAPTTGRVVVQVDGVE